MTAWERAALCAVLTTACPHLFGGVLVRAGQGPVLKHWIEQLTDLCLPDASPLVMPATVSVDRLHRSLSVARSLTEGRPIYQTGLLDDAQGRLIVVSGVERLRREVLTTLAVGLDESRRADAAIGLMAIDESRDLSEAVPTVLTERIAFRADLNDLRMQDVSVVDWSREDIEYIKTNMQACSVTDEDLTSIATACLSLGVTSMRVPVFCMHAARALAALDRRTKVMPEDITVGCQLVLLGRGQAVADAEPAPQPEQEPEAQSETSEPTPEDGTPDAEGEGDSQSMESKIIEAVMSAPVQMMSAPSRQNKRGKAGVSGRSGAHVLAFDRGRPDRPVRGQLDRGRVDVLATLRAAAPMQTARRAAAGDQGLKVRKPDLRIKRFKRRKQSSVIFVVDASGSAAIHRMAEAKGAVERLLSQCYARRDLVSLISFAGDHANLALPPSRSLVRAQRQISDLAGGGATPLAHAVVEAYKLARSEQDRGRTPFLVFLTDGRGNISLDGTADRKQSADQVSRLARTLIKGQFAAVYFDTSRRPDPRARQFGEDLGAQYQFLPNADSETVSRVVRQRIGSR